MYWQYTAMINSIFWFFLSHHKISESLCKKDYCWKIICLSFTKFWCVLHTTSVPYVLTIFPQFQSNVSGECLCFIYYKHFMMCFWTVYCYLLVLWVSCYAFAMRFVTCVDNVCCRVVTYYFCWPLIGPHITCSWCLLSYTFHIFISWYQNNIYVLTFVARATWKCFWRFGCDMFMPRSL